MTGSPRPSSSSVIVFLRVCTGPLLFRKNNAKASDGATVTESRHQNIRETGEHSGITADHLRTGKGSMR
jgi:hypothetical protein